MATDHRQRSSLYVEPWAWSCCGYGGSVESGRDQSTVDVLVDSTSPKTMVSIHATTLTMFSDYFGGEAASPRTVAPTAREEVPIAQFWEMACPRRVVCMSWW